MLMASKDRDAVPVYLTKIIKPGDVVESGTIFAVVVTLRPKVNN